MTLFTVLFALLRLVVVLVVLIFVKPWPSKLAIALGTGAMVLLNLFRMALWATGLWEMLYDISYNLPLIVPILFSLVELVIWIVILAGLAMFKPDAPALTRPDNLI